MVLTLFLLADYALQQFSGVFSYSTQKPLMPGLFLYWCKNSTVAGKQQGVPLGQGAGVGWMCGKQQGQRWGRCSGGAWPQPWEEEMCQQEARHLQRKGREYPMLLGVTEMNCSSEGLGSVSWQCKHTALSQRVRAIICSSKVVKRVMRDSRQWGASVLLLWMAYKTFLCVSTCFLHQWTKTKNGLGTLRKMMHLFFSFPHLRRGRPYIQNAHKTGARRKAVPEMCLFSRVENSWAVSSISVKGWGTELGTGRGTWSWLKTYHSQGKVGDLPTRSWGRRFSSAHRSPSKVKACAPRVTCSGHVPGAPREEPEPQHMQSGIFWSFRPQQKGVRMQQPGESPALTVDPWALGPLRKQHM